MKSLIPLSLNYEMTSYVCTYVIITGNEPVSQSCAVAKREKYCAPLENQTWHTNGWLQKLPKFGFHTYITSLPPMEQPFTLSAKFDCSVAHQNCSLLATVHDICETGLFTLRNLWEHYGNVCLYCVKKGASKSNYVYN